MARLAASICLAETQRVVKDIKAKEPKSKEVPLSSFPFDLPLCHFRCLTFLGINMDMNDETSLKRLLFEFFPFVNPNLYAYRPVSAISFFYGEINVSP